MLHIAVEKHSSLAVYRGEALDLTLQGLRTEHFIDPDLTPDNCEIHPCPPIEGEWLSGAYKLENSALILTEEGALLLAHAAAEREASLAASQKAPVPVSVSKFQAIEALAHFGFLDTVEAIIAAPETPPPMRRAWTHATEFLRESPTVAALAGILGLDTDTLDALFVYAEGVVA